MGFPVRLRVTTFLPRLTRLIVSRPDGGSASPLHQGDRNFTCTNFKLSKICWFTSFPCLGPPPWAVGPFRRNGSQRRLLPRAFQYFAQPIAVLRSYRTALRKRSFTE